MRLSAGVCVSVLAAALCACGMDPSTPTSSSTEGRILPAPISTLQSYLRRLESLPADVTAAMARTMQEEILASLDEMTALANAQEQAAALREVRKLQFLSHKRIAATLAPDAANVLLQLWNDAVEMEIVLRRVFGERIAHDLQDAVRRQDSEAIATMAAEMPEVGIGDFPGRIIDAIADTQDPEARSALITALASGSRGGMASAWLYEQFLANPTRELLTALVRAGLPTRKAREAFAKRRWGDPEWNGEGDGGIKASALDAIQFISHNNPQGRRKEEEKKAREKDEIRKAAERAVRVLADGDEGAMDLARPIIGPFEATRDAAGFFVETRGMKLREGDVLLYRFTPHGYSWESFSNSPARFSHVAMVTFSPEGKPLLADQGYVTVDFTEIEEGFARGMYSTLVRDTTLTPADRQKLHAALWAIGSSPHHFDYRFNLKDPSKSYCAELIYDVYQKAGLPLTFPLYTFQNERSEAFMRSLGVDDTTFVAPGSFPADKRFTYLGHIYENASESMMAGRLAVDALFSAFSRTTWADFSKAKGQGVVATTVDIFRIFNVGGLGIMSQAMARNVRSLDGSLKEVTTRVSGRLQSMGIGLEEMAQYRRTGERIAREEIADVYEKAFRY